MDKTAIKNYAVGARRKLIEAVKLKAQQLYIFEDSGEYIKRNIKPHDVVSELQSDGIFLSPDQLKARERLYAELLLEDIPYKPAIYNRLMENIACTWFNRLIALRIMEVNEWLPSGIRILSSREEGRIEPEVMREVERLDYIDQRKVAALRADTDINASEKLFKYILVSQCNALSDILPGMFEKENDYTELLLPDALLTKGGVVHDLVNAIHEDNFNVDEQGQIEIIGWLYQFYISEKKDEVFANLKKNVKINKDTIPAATQLFTPEWIVKYMVENSLGRLWLDNHPNDELRAKWKYYIDEAEQEPEVAEQLRVLRSQSPVKHPEDIKLIDPCMGSGHILVYAFDVLFQIYQSEGHSEREIPNLILQNNIYGLDIDDRAGQLAYFALMIKARSYNRRFFRQDNIPQPMVYAVPETNLRVFGLEKWLGASMAELDRKACYEDLKYLAEIFDKGKDYGSALRIERDIDYARLKKYVHDWSFEQITLEDSELLLQSENFDCVIDVAAVLAQKYDVVVTNPPYMGNSGMSAILTEYVKTNYPDSKSDMSTVFMEKTLEMCKTHGYMAMINIPVWMFITSYENLRKNILTANTICNMLHLGRGVFGSDFGSVSFVIGWQKIANYRGVYRRLFDKPGNVDVITQKEDWFFENKGYYANSIEKYSRLPGMPIAYWASDKIISLFDISPLSTSVEYKEGLTTANNDLFLRYWFEVSREVDSKWIPYNKGGAFRKWYGNNDYVVNWLNDGELIKQYPGSSFRNASYQRKHGGTFSALTAGAFSARYSVEGAAFDSKGTMFFSNELLVCLGYMNTKLFNQLLQYVCPTLDYRFGTIQKMPFLKADIEKIVNINIDLSKNDWDSFETSWDFKAHPLVQYKIIAGFTGGNYSGTIEQAFAWWKQNAERQFSRLKANEEELNRIFIGIYGLQDELTPEVEDKDVTVRKADLSRDIRSFLSYAVGCMFGRYSLDEPGLVFAGGKFDISRYKTFIPGEDNIIPIGSADYFDNDIVVRFTQFVRIVYGDNTLGENLNFIADALYPNGNGTAQERIRRYFLNDFYKDHVKIYQKKPIYWLLDSGKKDGFKALIYLHRYDKFTIARARTDYLFSLQRKYEAEIKRLEILSDSTDNARDKAAYRKEIDVLQAKIDECRVYDQVVSHIAHQQIELNLDDGVKVNYAKFQDVEVPKDNGKTETMDLLAKI